MKQLINFTVQLISEGNERWNVTLASEILGRFQVASLSGVIYILLPPPAHNSISLPT